MRPLVPFFFCLLNGSVVSAEPQSSFPVISHPAQRARDDDRRMILEAELVAERQALAKAQSTFDAAQTEEARAGVHRHRENVKALLREIDGVVAKLVPRTPRATVRSPRPLASSYARGGKPTLSYWNPYNRAPHSEISTTQRSTP